MNTLDELKYYINDRNPVGAIMLTGKWGCGKSYLIEHNLREEVQSSHILLRISLFGIASVEEIKETVKKEWISQYILQTSIESETAERATKVVKVVKKISDGIKGNLPTPFDTIVDGVLSVNVLDFMSVKPDMYGKRVVLVFDDLERSSISTNEFLGCINEYCENQHFHTIVVANEERIKGEDESGISYLEIKEKIIQRTVKYQPDFDSIVQSVISGMQCKEKSYADFLEKNINSIVALFKGERLSEEPQKQTINFYNQQAMEEQKKRENRISFLRTQRPQNIRSLKCAIADFERIYYELLNSSILEIHKWLFAFIAYEMVYRAGLFSDELLEEETVRTIYPGAYSGRYIFEEEKTWVKDGGWNLDNLRSEIQWLVNKQKVSTPKEIVRTYRLLEMEEKTLEEGFPLLLDDAYAGQLELDDYVQLICNASWARAYRIPIPTIDWNKIRDGIQTKFQSLIDSKICEPRFSKAISSRNDLSDEEWETYTLIHDFRENKVLTNTLNQTRYIESMNKEGNVNFIELSRERYSSFTKEMSEATARAYCRLSNEDKIEFRHSFISMWTSNFKSYDFHKDESVESVKYLINALKSAKEEWNNNNRYISVALVSDFINKLNAEFLD